MSHPAFSTNHHEGCPRREAAERGQVAVEWLMVAGILTAVAIIIVGIVQPVLVEMVRMLASSVRMVGL